MQRDLTAHFPLDSRAPVRNQIPGYDKNMNVDLARVTALGDLVGTDLGDFLQRAPDSQPTDGTGAARS